MTFDVLIIGSGLSGLFAGCLAARRGKKTLILARGVGGTHIGAGTIGVLDGDRRALNARIKSANHPYSKVGIRAVESALDEFKTICAEADYPLHGELGKNWTLPTAAGAARQTCLAPETMIAGDLNRAGSFALAQLPGFRDFSATLAANNLQSAICNLQLPHTPPHRDLYATDLARLFDRADYREQLIKAWKPLLQDAPKRIGTPAVLGLDQPLAAKQHLDSELGIELFEIPVLPPSVPGMRVFNILRNDFQNHGGQLSLGPTVSGHIEGGRASVVADMNGRTTEYAADTILLATGGFLNGGLVGEFDGAVRETVFDLPVDSRSGLQPRLQPQPRFSRQSWTSEVFLAPHPFSKFGLRVDKELRPLDASGRPAAANLRAIGSILAGADRLSEGSREGIELATALRAVEAA